MSAQTSRDRALAIASIVGIIFVSIGTGGAFGWAYGLLCFGAIILAISVVAS